MKPHKWAKEIHAWADGAEIQFRNPAFYDWTDVTAGCPAWDVLQCEYRVKPEPVYLYSSIGLPLTDSDGELEMRITEAIQAQYLGPSLRFTVLDGKVTAVELLK